MIYGKGFHIMTAFGKAENCFIGFVSLWCSQGLGMNSLASAPLLATSNPLHKKCPKTYFPCCSCLSVGNSVLQKTKLQGSSKQRVVMCNLLLLRERCFFFLKTSGKVQGWSSWWCCRLRSHLLSSVGTDGTWKFPSSLQHFSGFVLA